MTTLKAEKPLCESCGKPITHREGLNWCIDHEMSERTLQNRVVARAKKRGWTVGHAGKGWVGNLETGEGQYVTPMLPGWPDLFLLNPYAKGPKAFCIECKSEIGEMSEEQLSVGSLLIRCGIPVALIRPSDLREGRVNAILDGR